MKSPVTDDMIQYLAEMTLKVLPNNYKNIAYSHPSPPGSSNDPKHTHTFQQQQILSVLRSFHYATSHIQKRLLTTACYLNRLKRILPPDAREGV